MEDLELLMWLLMRLGFLIPKFVSKQMYVGLLLFILFENKYGYAFES
jgi:hypothetical protein